MKNYLINRLIKCEGIIVFLCLRYIHIVRDNIE